MADGYNGWTNWETWVTNLWIDEGVLDLFEVGEQARHFAETDESTAAYELGKWMRWQVEDFVGEPNASLVADYVAGAIGKVNWTEIAGHHIDEAIRNEKEQTENANA